jgi:hypothetical protein
MPRAQTRVSVRQDADRRTELQDQDNERYGELASLAGLVRTLGIGNVVAVNVWLQPLAGEPRGDLPPAPVGLAAKDASALR